MNLLLTSPAGRLDLTEAWVDIEVVYGFDPAAQLTVVCRDGERTLVNDRALDRDGHPPTLDLDGRTWRLQQTAKDGRQVTLTFEDERVALLRDQKGELTVTSGSLASFVRRLASDAGVNVDQVAVDDVDQQLSRDDAETSWSAIGRLAAEANARVLMTADGLTVAPDSDITARNEPLSLREQTGGVDFINFVVDARDRAQEATIEVRGEPGTIHPGVAARIDGLRPARGPWVVSQVTWRPHRTATTIDLIRPQVR